MNSLNILSGRVSPPQTPAPSRSNSYGSALGLAGATEVRRFVREGVDNEKLEDVDTIEDPPGENRQEPADEKSPLLQNIDTDITSAKVPSWHAIPRRIASVLINSLRLVVSTIAAPGVYFIACFYDERGQFAPLYQLCKLWPGRYRAQPSAQAVNVHTPDEARSPGRRGEKEKSSRRGSNRSGRYSLVSGSSSGLSSESESDRDPVVSEESLVARHTRSKSMQNPDEIAPARRSIRIKLNNEDSLRQRKHRKAQSASSQSNGSDTIPTIDISLAALKSPTSPAASLSMTKYPRAPAPPRPLIPRRQPSYSVANAPNGRMAQKTLILDLDETLIHSMAKGGRMSTGHMVEVKLNTYIGVAGQTVGPQHPILYYVHKRPHCDDFLRRVCKWYNLVVFTASVQEYADPVIDWLEQERKFFSSRFYRQHCTYRNGAFIKDLSSVEPDLSKVMILDNSPLSYMFHQDNAIPIEGWINDPTDNDLLHLVPLLEGLQHVTDVRALLALRGGEDGKHMIS